MIINTQTPSYPLLSPALAKSGKPLSQTNTAANADEAQLSSSADQLAVSENNLAAAIPDMDAAKSSVEFLRKNIISQPALAMMAQANSISRDALQLLQQ
jgi:flagellin-like hook-associated protein FlgL